MKADVLHQKVRHSGLVRIDRDRCRIRRPLPSAAPDSFGAAHRLRFWGSSYRAFASDRVLLFLCYSPHLEDPAGYFPGEAYPREGEGYKTARGPQKHPRVCKKKKCPQWTLFREPSMGFKPTSARQLKPFGSLAALHPLCFVLFRLSYDGILFCAPLGFGADGAGCFPIERAGLLRRNSQSRAMLPAG